MRRFIKLEFKERDYRNASPEERIEVDKKIAALDGAISLVSSGKVHVDQLKATYDKLLNEYLN